MAAVSPPMLCSTKKVLVSDSVIVIISKATAIPMVMTPIVNNSFERSSSSHKIIIKRLVIRINPALIKLILFFKNQKTFSAFFKEWLSFSWWMFLCKLLRYFLSEMLIFEYLIFFLNDCSRIFWRFLGKTHPGRAGSNFRKKRCRLFWQQDCPFDQDQSSACWFHFDWSRHLWQKHRLFGYSTVALSIGRKSWSRYS